MFRSVRWMSQYGTDIIIIMATWKENGGDIHTNVCIATPEMPAQPAKHKCTFVSLHIKHKMENMLACLTYIKLRHWPQNKESAMKTLS